jgi:hypothetical protein
MDFRQTLVRISLTSVPALCALARGEMGLTDWGLRITDSRLQIQDYRFKITEWICCVRYRHVVEGSAVAF